MAHNNSKPNYPSSSEEEEDEDPPSASEDDQTSNSNSDSDPPSDSDSDHKPNPKPQPKKPPIPPPKSKSSSEPEQDSPSDTDSDSPPQRSFPINPNIKPISSIPMNRERERERSNLDSRLGKKSGFKTSSTANKRPASGPAGNERELKKGKGNVVAEDDSKKQLFQRLWSEDDEIVILKGMIDYKNETGESLIADMGAFHEFIKKKLHVDVSRAQLVDKIRRLKKKYVNNASREKNGKDRSFSKSHEQKGYELSKLIWGSGSNNRIEGKKSKGQKNGNAGSTSGGNNAMLAQANGVDDKEFAMMEVERGMDISRFVRYGGRDESAVMPEEIVKAGMELVEGSKRVELEERWKSLKKQELELYLKKMEFIKEQALVVLEAVNSSGN